MNPLYVVTVIHSTGHGPQTSIVLATLSPIRAVDLARQIETMAYEFDSDQGVLIYHIDPEVIYDHQPGNPSRSHGTPTNSDVLVYARTLDQDWSKDPPEPCWSEYFFGEWKKTHP